VDRCIRSGARKVSPQTFLIEMRAVPPVQHDGEPLQGVAPGVQCVLSKGYSVWIIKKREGIGKEAFCL